MRRAVGYLLAVLARSLFLTLLAIAAHWPMLSLPDWRGTEGRRLQIALEMVHSGNWMVPMLGWEPTYAKPPLLYWILGALERLGADGFVLLRLPSVLALAGLAVLAFAILERHHGKNAAWIGALSIPLAPVMLHSGASIEIDPLFAALTVASIMLLGDGLARGSRSAFFWSGVAGGLAMLAKGPPFLMFAVGAWVAWWRRSGPRFLLPYFAPLLLLPLAYYVPLFLLHVRPSEFGAVAGEESIGRVLAMDFGDILETPLFWGKAALLLLPWLLFAPSTVLRSAGPGAPCLFAIVGALVVLTFFPHRPTRYMLPIVPLFAFAIAPHVARYAGGGKELGPIARRAVAALGVAGGLFLLAVPFLPAPFPGRGPVLALAFAAVPALARTRASLVGACWLLPILAAHTVLADQAGHWIRSGRGRTAAGRLLRAEIDGLGAAERMQTLGHLNSNLLVGARLLPPGDEFARRAPRRDFVLHETSPWPVLPEMADYAVRVVLTVPGDRYVLREKIE
ncbi:MAG: hypothetical protein Fur0037_22290 [Planctomycetota bacterium]